MRLLQPVEVAKILAISPETVHELVRQGSLNCVQITPKIRRFKMEHVEEFINAHLSKTFVPHPHGDSGLPDIETGPSDIPVKYSGNELAGIRKEM
ncbi:MAG: helix-turn-helix domain-containing protein, partial [Pseudomonadota bacterium]